MPLRLVRQMDSTKFAGANCGPVSTAHGLRWATDGRIDPTPAQVRAQLKGTWSGPGDATSLADQTRAWEEYRDDARSKHRLRLPAYERNVAQPWAEVLSALADGHAVALTFDHATWNRFARDKRAPTGDPNFMGLHVTFIPKMRTRKRKVELLDYDGLFDGRRKGIARGPQWVAASLMRAAAEQRVVIGFAETMPLAKAEAQAKGLATFGVIRKATKIVPKPPPVPDPEPDPTPEPTCEEEVAHLRAVVAHDLLTIEAHVKAAQHDADRIDDLELVVGTARTALLGIGDAADAAEAALADIAEALPDPEDDGTAVAAGVGADA